LKEQIKVVFASGSEDLIPSLIERVSELEPELPLYVVSEFPVEQGRWVPYHIQRTFRENYARCRAAFRGKQIRFSAAICEPGQPFRRMRFIAFLLSPLGFIAYNENLDHYMLRPRCAGTIVRNFLWRARNFAVWQLRPRGPARLFLRRLAHPGEFCRPLLYCAAVLAGWVTSWVKALAPPRGSLPPSANLPIGITVVIPSRNGRDLLTRLLPGLLHELDGGPHEVIVVDNGSGDGTDAFLKEKHPRVLIECSERPLSFARAVNRGIRRARYGFICLLNNDMVLEPGFFTALRGAFDRVPDLFCATAQILFPEGMRREETGKAVMSPVSPARKAEDFPIRCELPIPGEDLSYVLYGSGGCSLYSTEKLLALGCVGEVYEPAYVEDLDLGYRAWLRGWPTVFVAGARVTHLHRATTSRYFSSEELDLALERNYLRFLARSVVSRRVFRRLWSEAMQRLNKLASRKEPSPPQMAALAAAWRAPMWARRPPREVHSEELALALGSGDVAVFPGREPQGQPVVLVASPYPPFPLAHGGAVRIYNLMRRAAQHYDQVLVSFTEHLDTPPPELLEFCAEVVLVRRTGSHCMPSTFRPDVVEEFDSPAYRAALRQSVRKWRPTIAQLEFTQMAQYAADCTPAAVILVEHDITFDLHEQLLHLEEDWEVRRQLDKWRRFETAAWREAACVVVMSEKDQAAVTATCCEVIPNGVDVERFSPCERDPEKARLLFIGSFAHLPNLLAVEFFLNEVWPLLQEHSPTLHIIAGSRHRYYLQHHRDRVNVNLEQPGIEVEDFVADVRPAYRRAAVVIAPLVASAGTNIKILEAMAMGKAIVSTPAGINGLDLSPGRDVLVRSQPREFAGAVSELFRNPETRKALEHHARETAVTRFGWDRIAEQQKKLYERLASNPERQY
jgi:GT2 family glycosyltransferase/glycosyltransferase involved in cell wall biosynthesis